MRVRGKPQTGDVLPSGRVVAWAPHEGPQTQFLASTASEILYGGAASGGKSAAVIAMPLRWVSHPEFRCLVLRRETVDLRDLLYKASKLYHSLYPDVRYNGNDRTFTFPSGATVWFNHCQHDKDAFAYAGQEFQVQLWDELTHFSEFQYTEIGSRLRAAVPGLPRYTRATSNPGSSGHEWVMARFAPWLDPSCEWPGTQVRRDANGTKLPPLPPGKIAWVLPTDNGPSIVPKGTPGAMSRQFIPAYIDDNPTLLKHDPGYKARLMDRDPVRREQLLHGNWLIKPAKGLYFKRVWFDFLDEAPSTNILKRVRAWDLASTVDGDWTIGVRLVMYRDRSIVVDHVLRTRGTPQHVEDTIMRTAEEDGKVVVIRLPQDPGQAGVAQVAALTKLLMGYRTVFERPTGDKITRAGPVSSYCERRMVRIVRGPWTSPFLDVLEAFPEGTHDDDVDAFADAFNWISQAGPGLRLTQPAGDRRDMGGFG